MLGCLRCRRTRNSLVSAESCCSTASPCLCRTNFTATGAPQRRPHTTKPKPPLPKTRSGSNSTSLGSSSQCSCRPRVSMHAIWPATSALSSSSKALPVNVVGGAESDPEADRGPLRPTGPWSPSCSSRNSALHRSTRSCTSCTKAARSLSSRARKPTAAATTRPVSSRRFMTAAPSGLPNATRSAYRSTANTSRGSMIAHLTGNAT
mmetsp:Transcript_36907/g.111424  ORF Transcript_36907/g.111424 Transcript_36907/m.111424 type:complete len:206 (-) Transcript_36907:488-1105(-)